MEGNETAAAPNAAAKPGEGAGPPGPESPTKNSIYLWAEESPGSGATGGFRPWLEPCPVQSDRPRGAVIVFPGGGYQGRAPHEGSPVARRFNQAGLPAFVCQYRVKPARHPEPLRDAERAVRLVRAGAADWGVDPGRVAVIGFSAGGHLAGSVATFGADGDPGAGEPLDRLSARPDAAVLCYAVLSADDHTHVGSYRNLLGDDADEAARRAVSPVERVDARTPPCFLWSTADDPVVPVENSLAFAGAMRRHERPFALHVFPSGRHGLGLAAETPDAARWSELAIEWLLAMGW